MVEIWVRTILYPALDDGRHMARGRSRVTRRRTTSRDPKFQSWDKIKVGPCSKNLARIEYIFQIFSDILACSHCCTGSTAVTVWDICMKQRELK